MVVSAHYLAVQDGMAKNEKSTSSSPWPHHTLGHVISPLSSPSSSLSPSQYASYQPMHQTVTVLNVPANSPLIRTSYATFNDVPPKPLPKKDMSKTSCFFQHQLQQSHQQQVQHSYMYEKQFDLRPGVCDTGTSKPSPPLPTEGCNNDNSLEEYLASFLSDYGLQVSPGGAHISEIDQPSEFDILSEINANNHTLADNVDNPPLDLSQGRVSYSNEVNENEEEKPMTPLTVSATTYPGSKFRKISEMQKIKKDEESEGHPEAIPGPSVRLREPPPLLEINPGSSPGPEIYNPLEVWHKHKIHHGLRVIEPLHASTNPTCNDSPLHVKEDLLCKSPPSSIGAESASLSDAGSDSVFTSEENAQSSSVRGKSRRQKTLKIYEKGPFIDPEKERKRKNAINAYRNRQKQKEIVRNLSESNRSLKHVNSQCIKALKKSLSDIKRLREEVDLKRREREELEMKYHKRDNDLRREVETKNLFFDHINLIAGSFDDDNPAKKILKNFVKQQKNHGHLDSLS